MIPWLHLSTATMPGGGGTLRLMQRGQEFSIMAEGGIELMNSRLSGSEQALAGLTAERLAGRPGQRVLIGGLGMGFTLRAALAAWPKETRIVVGELAPEVVDWARGPMAAVYGGCLDDPRVSLAVGDVRDQIRGEAVWDAILLDVDNGPEGLTRRANDSLYDVAGLAAARAALKPGGVLAVWSSAPHAVFSRRVRSAGFVVEELKVKAGPGRRKASHVIWLAVKR
ncbi:spermidine synthase [Caulobacter sp. NIBR1757]|uniref:spermidine synthase n=1 Tax=Caulobacter sp. NIBR1757 TaxID=3016000 RepID=UPI0022EFF6D5|nr:spermidine synthase [Caulobacter sp. NIBR1757]WGM38961.1 Polyamine aminopropyltransferase [Caulobacter sp. NIBR1757]